MMNHQTKFDAVSFIFGGEIRNRTYTQKTNKQVRPSSGTDVYPHMPILRPHAERFHVWPARSLNYK